MKNQVIPVSFESSGCIGFDDEWLYISREKNHHAFEELLYHAMAFRKSGTNGYAAIAFSSITEIQFHERVADFFIRYKTEKAKPTKYYFNIKDAQTRKIFCEALARECALDSRTEQKNPFAQLGLNLMFLIISGLVTCAFAYFPSNGQYTSRRALVQLMSQLIELVGPKVCIAIGSAFCLFYLFRIFRNIIHPKKTIKYHKS